MEYSNEDPMRAEKPLEGKETQSTIHSSEFVSVPLKFKM
jgi:hypothetical protein